MAMAMFYRQVLQLCPDVQLGRHTPDCTLSQLPISISINMLCTTELFWLLCVLTDLKHQLPVVWAERKYSVCVYTHTAGAHVLVSRTCCPEARIWGTDGAVGHVAVLKQHSNCFCLFMALDLCFLSTHQICRYIRHVFLMQEHSLLCCLTCCLPMLPPS